MGIIGIKGLKRSVFALVAILPVSCGQVTVQPTAMSGQGSEDALGTLSLTSEAFPEGAERLVLSIARADLPRPCGVVKPGITTLPVSFSDGANLSQASDGVKCIPPQLIKPHALEIANKPNSAWEKIIQVKKGEEIAPIQLRSGTYYARANFYNAESIQLYHGDETFALSAGEKKSIKIRLRKVDSGEITVGFEVDKPEVLPTHISGGSHVELRRKPGFGLTKRLVEDVMDIDLSTGVAVLSAVCLNGEAGSCQGEMAAKKIPLTKTAIRKINEILTSVSLKSGQDDRLCVDDFEYIALVLKRCQECESGKQYKFSNARCGNPYHTLNSKQFTEIRNAVIGFNVPFETAANH
jgi:hypothetical protein